MTLRLKAESFDDIDLDLLGKHIKVIIPREDGELYLPQEKKDDLTWPHGKHHLKTYTIASVEGREIEIDFCLHDQGLAANWARNVKVGEKAGMLGPKTKQKESFDMNQDEFLFISDLTGIGTLRSLLKMIPETAKGEFFVFLESKNDVFSFDSHPNFKVHWIIGDKFSKGILSALKKVNFENYSSMSVYAIGPSKGIKKVKDHIKDFKHINSENLYFKGYWK